MRMNYFVVGTNDMNAAARFYDSLFEDSGLNRIAPSDRMTYWLGEDFAFAIARPFDEKPATNGNGTMVGFSLGTAEAVSRLHDRAIELGGTCEGLPGQRGPRFSAYVRDLDGNKLCFSD
ncbi:VOC family protein [uncultured Hyphomonas sp.]|uniref:VOC family protein n=1 Tax=uncultured Hyphomonas sp. TaxID=225298 RepID=UPI002AAB86AE|nr:VOC family protein [uncultured Hyphomonas sp.]